MNCCCQTLIELSLEDTVIQACHHIDWVFKIKARITPLSSGSEWLSTQMKQKSWTGWEDKGNGSLLMPMHFAHWAEKITRGMNETSVLRVIIFNRVKLLRSTFDIKTEFDIFWPMLMSAVSSHGHCKGQKYILNGYKFFGPLRYFCYIFEINIISHCSIQLPFLQ